ncbi:MAG: alpha/beta hydrolase [Verrucomicrobiae bacterium]|nr:alpha/beta hydrolase [Verrucomicrobiae bacterium]
MRRALRIALWCLAGLLLFAGVLGGGLWWYFHPAHVRSGPIVYGRRQGQDLTLEVVRPRHPNGLGVVLMVSGGWKSGTNSFRPWMAAPLLRQGYTILPICHVSQPKATVMEIVEDVGRGVRFVRHHAREYGVDPDRLGVTGGSAGGHLSLMMATRGGPGPASAADPVDRESSAVQAVAIFYPVTDLLNLGDSTENLHDGGPPRSFVKAFGPDSTNRAVWAVIGRDLSPIAHIASNLPPTLIYHGDADTLVPLDQSQRFQARARELGKTVDLVVHRGGRHGWPTMLWDLRNFASWFDRYLRSRPGGDSR